MEKTSNQKFDLNTKIYEFDKNFGFTMIVNQKKEDAEPYLDDELLICCDGLGGSGSSVHDVDETKIDTFEEVKDIILPELEGSTVMDNYLKELFNFLINGDNLTSALWGSRVLMSRFVFAYKLLKMNNMDEIKKFIYDGHKYVKAKLELKTGGIRQQLLLPSTFCAIKYQELENKVKCKAFWAGDSRGYVLTNNGLQLLTIDNENEATGGINNLFYESDEDHTRIDSLDYEFEMPCALFTCSDGIFDNREAIQIENIFIENLVESKDIEEYKNKLSQYFTDHLQDDSTIAMKFFGFDSFEQIKEYFKERYNKTKDLLNKVNENINYILLKQDELLYTDTKDVLLNRCKSRIKNIMNDFVNEYRNENECLNLIIDKKDDNSKVLKYRKLIEELDLYLKNNPYEYLNVFNIDVIYDTKLKKHIDSVIKILVKHNEVLSLSKEINSIFDDIKEIYLSVVNEEKEIKNEINKDLDSSINVLNNISEKVLDGKDFSNDTNESSFRRYDNNKFTTFTRFSCQLYVYHNVINYMSKCLNHLISNEISNFKLDKESKLLFKQIDVFAKNQSIEEIKDNIEKLAYKIKNIINKFNECYKLIVNKEKIINKAFEQNNIKNIIDLLHPYEKINDFHKNIFDYIYDKQIDIFSSGADNEELNKLLLNIKDTFKSSNNDSFEVNSYVNELLSTDLDLYIKVFEIRTNAYILDNKTPSVFDKYINKANWEKYIAFHKYMVLDQNDKLLLDKVYNDYIEFDKNYEKLIEDKTPVVLTNID